MAPLNVTIKHAGKVHAVTLDPELPPVAFKEAIYQVTGVPVDRMKVMIKGGMLKDDTNWKKVAPKEAHQFMVIGTAGELPKAPEKATVFLEDMDDSELAEALAKPVGLTNLGNTCYMNASLQALRSIPELETALNSTSNTSSPLPQSLRSLISSMTKTTEAVTPTSFLNTLRQVQPRFAEVDRSGGKMTGMMSMGGYAQQDAEECFSEIINSFRSLEGVANEHGPKKSFVEQFMMGNIRRTLSCPDAPDETPTVMEEPILKIECNITVTTNYLSSGILSSLTQSVTKRSPSLGREATYTQTSRLTRLPKYLTVHMVRFAWKADINKRAKIMKRVKFPEVYDATELASDELKSKLEPVANRLKDLEKARAERRKVRKRTKASKESAAKPAAPSGDVEMGDASTAAEQQVEEGGELSPEGVYREKEGKELEALVHADLKTDVGCSEHGLYELVAIVTHKGAAANSGHYIGFVKKSVFHGRGSAKPAPSPAEETNGEGSSSTPAPAEAVPSWEAEEDEDWYKFDDDKVSIFPRDKLSTLEGGGQDSSAYVLLYRSKSLV
ncbi:hypothetical protein BDV98DRAFT_575421 [Pterulicium gracile]|uniref:Ubiquitin carboxyl-terminal hydrolase n=1 Tax=Pterulicium gracile TaxID=1884261 RepID=A0A5C3Q6Z2_9AGAR|nr:hypothetical protein BDV98DRAFT_575421 [Pterula gracilis]